MARKQIPTTDDITKRIAEVKKTRDELKERQYQLAPQSFTDAEVKAEYKNVCADIAESDEEIGRLAVALESLERQAA
jgi:hypothetical protein